MHGMHWFPCGSAVRLKKREAKYLQKNSAKLMLIMFHVGNRFATPSATALSQSKHVALTFFLFGRAEEAAGNVKRTEPASGLPWRHFRICASLPPDYAAGIVSLQSTVWSA
jgi:hypothetical protein